jgi:tetraacyldisaccharide 4'-kinase
MFSKRVNNKDVIEKGSKLYWYFWHLINEGDKNPLDFLLLVILKFLIPAYYIGLFLTRLKKKPLFLEKKYPVISVGNLTMGGTGKTPCVEFLLKKLLDKRKKPALLTAGYGRNLKGGKEIISSKDKSNIDFRQIGDEPCLFSKHFPKVPVFISRNRLKSFLYAAQKGNNDVFIMDDGFQYKSLNRELEILLINKRNPFGNGSLFPAGPLREAVNLVKRADLIILTHADEGDSVKNEQIKSVLSQKSPDTPVLESIHKSLYLKDIGSDKKYSLTELAGKKVLCLSSLADPVSFEKTVKKLSNNIAKNVRFPDHYVYKSEDMKWLYNLAKEEKVEFVITTEKDLVRFPKDYKPPIPTLCLVIDFQIIKGEDIIDNFIEKTL